VTPPHPILLASSATRVGDPTKVPPEHQEAPVLGVSAQVALTQAREVLMMQAQEVPMLQV
jgi:hypothetical protein